MLIGHMCLSVLPEAAIARTGSFTSSLLDIGDAKSTSNLHQHVKVCWGEEAMAAANNTWGVKTAQDVLAHVKVMDGSIMVLFQCAAKGRVTLQSLPTH